MTEPAKIKTVVRVSSDPAIQRWLAIQSTASESVNRLIRDEIAVGGYTDISAGVKQKRAKRRKTP